ncbi:NAD(P)-dependent nickel-iron dehydrogenase flavin-containing subunit [Azonexus fungiphilus]|uniref:NAD(P)-dependent nickel-iron dehydrogenase flavin-containing subunit n=1 Tax=Azonexus fungiphilus TaxID=146940 RepID=A0A495WCD5_9RHOO|nr:NAD(P)-dependent nickel-iron dehydrogenase flavin-containing subunit [Azonexus fungiphilus]
MPTVFVSTELANLIEPILLRHRARPDRLVQILREVQEVADFISDETAAWLAERLRISYAQVKSTRDFYAFFYRENRGRYRILFSDNITDRMAGNQALFEHMLKRLRLEPGKVSDDGLVSVDYTSCTGMCDQGPAILVNNRTITRMTPRRVDEICDLVRGKVPLSQWPAEFFVVEDNIHRADMLLGTPHEPGKAVHAAIARGRDGMLGEMKLSNLRGRGGAGFTTAVKWDACRNANGDTRYIVCNADEGEPGTFKDRVLLQSYAGRVFEGMAIAAYVVGASQGFLYLRGEYLYLLPQLEAYLAGMRSAGLLGRSIGGVAGFDFDIEIHLGAGAYVCGEETALIESLEGKAGRPRVRPPFPVTSGYMGQPTVVNNVETLSKVTEIAIHGGAWYEAIGTKQSTGTKILSVSGDCERPGLYEYAFGVRIAQVLEDCGAQEAIAVQISGASGVCLSEREFGRRIAFEDVPTAGSFMIFGKQRDMFEVARNFSHFFAHESCGFCTPCRVGTSLLKNIMDKIADGRGTQYEMNELLRLQQVLKPGSHCGLGQTAGNAVADTVQKFRPAYERRLAETDFVPAFDLDAALARARELTGRDDAAAHLGEEA